MFEAVVAPDLPPAPRPRLAVAQAQHVAGNGTEWGAVLGGFALHVTNHVRFNRLPRDARGHRAKVVRVPGGQPPGVVIRLAADHHAVGVLQLLNHVRLLVDAAVDGNRQLRKVGFEPMHQFIAQRRNFTVFFRAQALEPGVAGVHDEHYATRVGHGADKVAHKVIALGLVDANAVLDRHRHPGRVHHVHHGFDAVGHQLGFGHQAGAKGPALHPLARAAAVDVDLVIPPLRPQLRAARQVGRVTAAQLQCHGVLFHVEAQVPRHVAMDQRAGGHHLGVQQGVPGQQPVKVATVAVGPVHHGGDGHFSLVIQQLDVSIHGQAGRGGSRLCPPTGSALHPCRPVFSHRVVSYRLSQHDLEKQAARWPIKPPTADGCPGNITPRS